MNNALGLVETKGLVAPLKPPMQWLNPPTYSWWATKKLVLAWLPSWFAATSARLKQP